MESCQLETNQVHMFVSVYKYTVYLVPGLTVFWGRFRRNLNLLFGSGIESQVMTNIVEHAACERA